MSPLAWCARRLTIALPFLSTLLACQPDVLPAPRRAPVTPVTLTHPDAPSPTATPAVDPSTVPLCERESADAVRDAFCNGTSAIHGLADLQASVGLDPAIPPDGGGIPTLGGYETADQAVAVLLGHSTALSGELVSPINPRAILLNGVTLMAFNRGVQQVELASVDRVNGILNFYLVTFEQACNASARGCVPGDLYTPRLEADWTSVSLADAEDLKNTPSDCRQCHQRGTKSPLILMREFDGPWTHYFGPDVDTSSDFPEATGSDLTRDYFRARGDEPYAAMPKSLLRSTIGLTLENVVLFSQPLVFDGVAIMNERWPWTKPSPMHPTGYEPEPRKSATWYAGYEAFKRGEQLALPFYAPRATDPDKQARLTAAYQSYLKGDTTADSLPDLSDIFPDDPETRAEIGLQTEPGATPAQALVQACGTCHNDVLDQTISRARFNVAVGRLPQLELAAAIERLNTPRDAPGTMPPPGRRQLDEDGRARLIDYLKRNVRTSDDDALLEHAARLGMVPPRTY